ncbi:MAG: hypothetical protein JXR40_10160 [Pontiellaceae bacterium]|nr:hypothetical protein [Pontiellaceae bacterium]
MNVAVVAVIMVFAIPIVAIICGTIAGVMGKRSSKEDPEQARMIQDIYHGLERMERRVENLETILFDSNKKERS